MIKKIIYKIENLTVKQLKPLPFVRKNIFEIHAPWRVRYFKAPLLCFDEELVISN